MLFSSYRKIFDFLKSFSQMLKREFNKHNGEAQY